MPSPILLYPDLDLCASLLISQTLTSLMVPLTWHHYPSAAASTVLCHKRVQYGFTFGVFWHGQRQPTHIHTKLAGNAGVSACKSNTWNCANHQRHFNHQFLSTRNMDIHLCENPQVKENNIMRPHRIAAPRTCHTPHTADCLKISFSSQTHLANTLAASLTVSNCLLYVPCL